MLHSNLEVRVVSVAVFVTMPNVKQGSQCAYGVTIRRVLAIIDGV